MRSTSQCILCAVTIQIIELLMFASLNGFGAGPCESMMPQIIADIIFLHDRGKYQTLYFTIYFGSLAVRM